MTVQWADFGMTWFRGTRLGHKVASVLLALVLVVAMVPEASAETTSAFDEFPDSMSLARVNVAIGADVVHAAGYTGAGIDVAVIDTGVNNVPGLASAGKIVDAIDLSFDAGDEALRYRDLYGHGTVMAGIIAGDAASGSELTEGVAPGARIVNVKVGAGDGTVDVTQVIAGIDWVIQHRNDAGMNIRVISLAFGTDADVDWHSDPLVHAVENAWRAGIVVVVAGGNDGKTEGHLGNPALDPYVIAVGAASYEWGANKPWTVPSWSSVGNQSRPIDVIAPGALIIGPRVPGSYLDLGYPGAAKTSTTGETFFRGSGTSQAQAVVAGSVALMLQANPALTPDEVKASLEDSAIRVPGPVTRTGEGAIDLPAAIGTPSFGATQNHGTSNGLGSIQAARGSLPGPVTGEAHAFDGAWDGATWTGATWTGATWTNETWNGATWTGGTWMGATWTGATWTGATWTGATWTSNGWTGATWTGATWTGATWTGATWTGATWTGATWTGATWTGATWSSLLWQ
ncbi:MAG: S8 family serine peptidase [Acidimicrobiia bacterium]|nr:S8 family serine peptidase [Acidimicrobiia bacterium]